MTEIVFAVAGKVSEYLVAPIGRQLGYMFCYRTHTDDLLNNVQTLVTAREDLQISVDEAMRRGDQIRPIVLEWLNRVDEITGEAEELMKKQNQSCLNGWCPNLKSRYQLGREACKKAQVIAGIQEARNFPDGVSHHVPPRTMTFKEYECFESRASTLNKIMDALRDDKMKMIGVWGMGGVGKTTLVKQVAEQAKKEKLFATQIYIDVSWTREGDKIQQGISDIQQHIADMLGLEFKNEAQSTKAAKLMQRLKSEKILIILDDIWKEVHLGEVGIPSCKDDDQKDCKIVLASRNGDLLRKDMGVQECFPIQHLQEKEAWHLFKKTTGDSVEGDALRPIAIEVVNECGGLPIAIVTTAKALKDESVAVWKNALDELRSCAPTNIRGVEEKVYTCLELSYKHLKGEEVKSLFLLYGCLSYGDISMEQLLRYAMGLDFFDSIKSLEQSRNKLVTLVTTLKASSLLLDGEDNKEYYFRGGASRLLFMDIDDNKSVKMHDVVRDVARNIASKDPHRFVVKEDVPLEDLSDIDEFKYISLNCKAVHKLPHMLVCPKLQFFLLQNNNRASLNVPDTFFEGMNRLKVLDLSETRLPTLPSTLQSLANLRTLCLDRCELGDIAGIGELKKLQVLSMVGSYIRQLPKEMVQLTDLRLLDLNGCKYLEVIPRNILSSLSRLECLCMISSFKQWAAEGVSAGESNACLSELNHLRYLRMIEIEIPYVELVPKEDKFFENLTSYAIFIGNSDWSEEPYKRTKTLRLKGGDGSLLLRNGMSKLLEKTEELELMTLKGIICNNEKNDSSGGLFSPSMPLSFHNLKYLYISYREKEEDRDNGNVNIFIEDGALFGEKVSFPNLEEFKLNGLSMLKTIWHPQFPHEIFDKLRILNVHTCPHLLTLIPSHLIQCFQNLKEVVVCDCKVLECVFDHQGLDRDNRIFPKIEILKLEKLPNLRLIFCNKDNNDNSLLSPSKFKDFHHFKQLHIIQCGKLLDEKISLPSNLEVLVLESFHKLKEIDFGINPKLKFLTLEKLPKLSNIICNEDENAGKRGLYSPSMFKNFHSLEGLRIIDCGIEDTRGVYTPANGVVLSNEKVPFLDGVCNYEGFESRGPTLNKIMDALRDDNINSIGVVGIGGVGKTTVLKQVAQQAMERQLFTKQVYIDVSWSRHSGKRQGVISDVQHKISKALGLILWGWDDSTRAIGLKRRLEETMKKEKILLILDDIWKEIDMEEIGIPSFGCKDDAKNGSKIVFTCRDGEVLCKDMGAQICFPVETLPLEEAWTLFKKTAITSGGDCDNWVVEEENIPEEIRSIAIQVVEECEGLPRAIVTIAKALKDETSLSVWNNALEHLKSSTQTNMISAGGSNKVYSCLESIYTHLKGIDVKSLLLLCGMLSNYGSQDGIRMDHLLQYAVGLDLFDRTDSLDQARNKLLSVSTWLLEGHDIEYKQHIYEEERDSTLLFRDTDDKFVSMRMGDVFYDVAREIASKDHPHRFVVREDARLEAWSETEESKLCAFISLHCKSMRVQLPQVLVCPELKFFLSHNDSFKNISIPNTFFQGMKKLQVLDLFGAGFRRVPSSLDSLANLRTLRLDHWRCNSEDIALIGQLTKLEVLSLVGSTVDQLPNEMVKLTNLRLLNLNHCWALEIIPRYILSSLSRLECLFMRHSFTKWAVEGDQSNANTCLSELNHLSYLTTLAIDIPDAKLLSKSIKLENLTRYAIFVGYSWDLRTYRTLLRLRTDRTLKLREVNRSLHLGDGISKLLEISEELEFQALKGTKCVLSPSNSESFLELKHLNVNRSPQIQYIIYSKDQQFLQHGEFPLLESLVIWELINLQQIWYGPIPIGSFGNLKTLSVSACPKLRYFFQFSMARGLSRLEDISIRYCIAMQQIIAYERELEDEYGGGETNLELFPNLRSLKLKGLPELTNFISELETSSTCSSTNAMPKDSFFSHKVSLSKLEVLELLEVPKLKDIWHH